MNAMDTVTAPIHREGRVFAVIFAAVTALLFSVWAPLGWAGVVATLWCLYFFRDPERIVPDRKGVLVTPGDGTVSLVGEVVPPAELDMGDEPMQRVTVFLNVFNVHVNRVPAAGEIDKLVYVPGLFVNAAADDASEKNERQLVSMTTEDGDKIAFAQIAGAVARRILCDLKEGQTVERGERYGLIRFGSRMDIWVPNNYKVLVAPGQTMVCGETVIAERQE